MKKRYPQSILPLILAILMLHGCQSPDRRGQAPADIPRPPGLPETGNSPDTTHAPTAENPAVTMLLATVDKAAASGDVVSARATLERALRIEPRNARLWNELAQLYYRDGKYIEAANTAAKSNALAGSDLSLKHDNWLLIARSRSRIGDKSGAREAEIKARTYR